MFIIGCVVIKNLQNLTKNEILIIDSLPLLYSKTYFAGENFHEILKTGSNRIFYKKNCICDYSRIIPTQYQNVDTTIL